jgi:hypothetical protein
MSENESKIPETPELRLQQVVQMVEGVVREIEVRRGKIRAQIRSVSNAGDRAPLINELQGLEHLRRQLKNCITTAGGQPAPEKSEPVQPVNPLAIGRYVSQACVSFELLEGFKNGSIKASLPPVSSGGLPAEGTLWRSLVMHFVFLVARVHRLCSGAKNLAGVIPQDAIEKFTIAVGPIVRIRHANEHGHDPDRWSDLNRKKAKYLLPFLGEIELVYDEEAFRWDKTGPWMGDVLLRPIYEATKEFEKVAGYAPIAIALRQGNDAEQSGSEAAIGNENATGSTR